MLTACATAPPVRAPLDAVQQEDQLLQLKVFSIAGKVSVAPQGFSASVKWQQQQNVAKLVLSGPVGSGSMQLEYSPASLDVATSRGDHIAGAEAEAFLTRELGFLPPFDVLRYWILGVPAPGLAAVQTRDETGRLRTLAQQGWLIRYELRMPVDTTAGRMQLPATLVVERDDLRLKLVVKNWLLK